MKCPRCEQSVLDERVRDGVVVDVCRECRGVWLDRSELERIVARAIEEQERYAGESRGPAEPYRPSPSSAPGGYYHGERERESTPPHGHRVDDPRYQGKRKRHWFESLSDIFD